MPGFTHLQVAQPVVFAHHLLAYVEMLFRDTARLHDARKRINQLPLGAAALAGTSYPIRRERVAELLGFEGLCANSMDAVSDRDFAIEFTAAASLVMMHLSRLAEELILWSSPRFAFIELADEFCTGSSIMPQKKNPDVPELMRGKVGRVYGHLLALLTIMKGQPLAYNKDNQEDKEPLFDAAHTVISSVQMCAELFSHITVHAPHMRRAVQEGFATATDLADYLVKQGMPFKTAHEMVAQIVSYHVQQGKVDLDLTHLPAAIVTALAPYAPLPAFTLEQSVQSRNHMGGTAPEQVRMAIVQAEKRLANGIDSSCSKIAVVLRLTNVCHVLWWCNGC